VAGADELEDAAAKLGQAQSALRADRLRPVHGPREAALMDMVGLAERGKYLGAA
jgi:hypothetical protein